jgi:Ala-tRNA(Pro) deacylase
MRVAEFLNGERIAFETLLHAPAYTAQHRAKYLGVSGNQVAKAVLLHSGDGYLLAVLPAPRRVDTERLGAILGTTVTLATGKEVAVVFRDCEWGVVGPFGKLYGIPSILDTSIELDQMMIFESDTHAEAIRIRCRDYEALEGPKRLSFAIA